MWWKIILWLLGLFLFWFLLESFIYRDFLKSSEHGVWLISGKMGSGKTTLEQRLICEYVLRGWRIFSNFEMACASLIDNDDFYKYSYPRDSLILLDEAGVFWNNRDWKGFPREFVVFLKSARKFGLKIVFISQSADVDKTIRQLCDRVYLLKKIWLFSVARAYACEPKLLNNGSVSDSKWGTEFGDVFGPVPITVKGALLLTWLPRYSGLFDSFESILDLPAADIVAAVDSYRASKKWYRAYRFNYWRSSFSSFFTGLTARFKRPVKGNDESDDSDDADDEPSSLFVLGDSDDNKPL